MAGLKEVKKRINSVRNIRKITKTMEMVSAAKSRKMMNRVHDSKPYGEKILSLMELLSSMSMDIQIPLFKQPEDPKTYLLVIITGNRGLCGAYNSNVLKLARTRIKELQESGKNIRLFVIGKKGAAYFKFVKLAVEKVFLNFDDKFKLEDAKNLLDILIENYLKKETDIVEIISTHYFTSTTQKPQILQLIPFKPQIKPDSKKKKVNYVMYPSSEMILKKLVPHVLEYSMYKLILEAVTSEQIYRRIAMKSASDAANDMGKILVRSYNRKRQGKITQEISEIVTGADAIQ